MRVVVVLLLIFDLVVTILYPQYAGLGRGRLSFDRFDRFSTVFPLFIFAWA